MKIKKTITAVEYQQMKQNQYYKDCKGNGTSAFNQEYYRTQPDVEIEVEVDDTEVKDLQPVEQKETKIVSITPKKQSEIVTEMKKVATTVKPEDTTTKKNNYLTKKGKPVAKHQPRVARKAKKKAKKIAMQKMQAKTLADHRKKLLRIAATAKPKGTPYVKPKQSTKQIPLNTTNAQKIAA